MTGKRKRYSAEFKAKVALEAIRGEATVAQLTVKYGVHQTMINAWKKQAVEGMADVFSGKSEALEAARGKNAPAGEIQAIEARAKAAEDEMGKKMAELKAAVMDPLADKVGVFEGAGYASKGLYRPMIYCIMISSPKNEFCRVCQRAIARMTDFLSGRG